MLVEKVNGLDPEALERAFDRLPDALPAGWRRRDSRPVAGSMSKPNLVAIDHTVAERTQRLADDLLVLERPIDLGGVEEGDAPVDRGADELDAFLLR